MKKLLKIVLVIAIAGIVASFFLRKKISVALGGPEAKACAKMGDLCSNDASAKSNVDKCVDTMTEAKKIAGQKSVDQSVACIQEAKTCGAAMGCVVGGVGVGTVKEMAKGVGDAVTR